MLTTPAVGRGWQRDGAGGTPGVAAPAGPGPEERQHWWWSRRGRSYTLHTAEALAEDQGRRSGGAREDLGRR